MVALKTPHFHFVFWTAGTAPRPFSVIVFTCEIT